MLPPRVTLSITARHNRTIPLQYTYTVHMSDLHTAQAPVSDMTRHSKCPEQYGYHLTSKLSAQNCATLLHSFSKRYREETQYSGAGGGEWWPLPWLLVLTQQAPLSHAAPAARQHRPPAQSATVQLTTEYSEAILSNTLVKSLLRKTHYWYWYLC